MTNEDMFKEVNEKVPQLYYTDLLKMAEISKMASERSMELTHLPDGEESVTYIPVLLMRLTAQVTRLVDTLQLIEIEKRK